MKPATPPAESRLLYLPNFCSASAVLAIVIICELTALLLALARNVAAVSFWADLGLTSMFLLWIALCGAGALCLLRGYLQRLVQGENQSEVRRGQPAMPSRRHAPLPIPGVEGDVPAQPGTGPGHRVLVDAHRSSVGRGQRERRPRQLQHRLRETRPLGVVAGPGATDRGQQPGRDQIPQIALGLLDSEAFGLSLLIVSSVS